MGNNTMASLLILAWVVPLVLAVPAVQRRLPWAPALAAVPGLVAGLLVPLGSELEIPWLLVGATFGLDEIGRIFLLFTAVLWLIAGVYASLALQDDPRADRFAFFFLLAMAGNLWLIVSQDLIGFYAGFALMGLASYGLVIHHGDRAALRAGKVYLVLTLCGEVTLFAAIIMIAATSGTLHPTPEQLATLDDLTIALLILGLAFKASLVPLHISLPLAYPAAPIPASAVLSGAMIKVAILGWLRWLPIGAIALPEWGLLFVFVGLLTAFVAVPIGLVQSNPKVLLAYSSISKMGLMATVIGVMLIEPGVAPAAAVGLALYAGHHALTKGGLFLGIGLRQGAPLQPFVLLGITWLALSLAAVPLTSGAVAKYGIKPALSGIDWTWFGVPIALTTLATAWLMARLLWILWHQAPSHRPQLLWATAGWLVLPVMVLLYPLLLGSPGAWLTDAGVIALAVILALPVALLAQAKPRATATIIDAIPAGDLIRLIRPAVIAWRWLAYRLLRLGDRYLSETRQRIEGRLEALAAKPLPDLDRALRHWPIGGGLWLAIVAGLIGLTLVAPPKIPTPPTPSEPVGPEAALVEPPMQLPPEAGNAGPPIVEGAGLDSEVADDVDQDADPDAGPDADLDSDPPDLDESLNDVGPVPPAEAPAPDKKPRVASPAMPEPPTEAPAVLDEPSGQRMQDDPGVVDEARAPVDILDKGSVHQPKEPAPGSPAPPVAMACDPDAVDVFAHQASGESVRLARCVLSDGEPKLLATPDITASLVRLVQRHLADLGFDPGPIDGLMGPRTRAAIERFERDQGLPESGEISFELLDRIRRATAP